MWTWIKDFFSRPRRMAELRVRAALDCSLWHSASAESRRLQIERDDWKAKYEVLRAQLVQVRVSQSSLSRAGWEVMCFIPEEVVQRLVKENSEFSDLHYRRLVDRVAKALVELAIHGIVRVSSEGKCCALVFEPLNTQEAPRAPRYVQALWDNEGKFKLSEKCWDKRTEEQRVKSAAGCGGYGV